MSLASKVSDEGEPSPSGQFSDERVTIPTL
jgi:hypothetical protein